MSDKWTFCKVTFEDGSPGMFLADRAFTSKSARGQRDTLLAVNFPGTYMMEAQERRDSFDEVMEDFLQAHDGVYVAGVTRFDQSYTFMYYLGRRADRSDVPIPVECVDIARIWFAYDPNWREYSSLVPSRPTFFERLKSWFKPSRPAGLIPLASLPYGTGDADELVLRALAAAGSDLSKATDIVFYLYVPMREHAEYCHLTLWENRYRARVCTPLGDLGDGTSDSRWSVISNLEAVPTLETIRASRQLMELLARQVGGEYDGWEAAFAR